jgi:hypothetical protein
MDKADINEYGVLCELLKYLPPYYTIICKQWRYVYYANKYMLYWLYKVRPYMTRFKDHNDDDDVMLATVSYGAFKPTIKNIYINLCFGHIEIYKQHKQMFDKIDIESINAAIGDDELKHKKHMFKCLIKRGYVKEVISMVSKKHGIPNIIYKYIIKQDMLAETDIKYDWQDKVLAYVFKYDAVKSLQAINNYKCDKLYSYALIFNATKILKYCGDGYKYIHRLPRLLDYDECFNVTTRFDKELSYLAGKISYNKYFKYFKNNLPYAAKIIIYMNKIYYKHELYINLFLLAIQHADLFENKSIIELIRYGKLDLIEIEFEKRYYNPPVVEHIYKKLIKHKLYYLQAYIASSYKVRSVDINRMLAEIDMAKTSKQ